MNISNSNRIAKNTLMLYIRQILILFVSLYSVRVLLNVLGVEDYGIYNVVGGIVSFFSFLSGTMASATQRFFSYAIGEKNFQKLKEVFTASWVIYVAIAIIAFVLLETVGLWFVSKHLQVSADKMASVLFIYQFSVLTFITTIISTPFMAIIIAHEDMQIYAYLSIVEAITKLGVTFLLMYLPGTKLELYGMLLFVASSITTALYFIVALMKYQECQFRQYYWNKKLFVEIVKFTSWTLFGQISNVARNQATTILINQLFNPIVVAARAIALSVTNQINVFSNNFNTGLYPPIIKSYAADNKMEMFNLIYSGSKITFFLMWVFALPLFLEMDTILNLWLGDAPANAVLFTRLSLIEVLITSVGLPLTTAARAPGKMRIYELSIGGIQLCTFLLTWFVLSVIGIVYTVFIVAITANIIIFITRLYLLRNLIEFPVNVFIKKVVVPIIVISFTSAVPSALLKHLLPNGLFFSCLSILVTVLLSTFSMYYIGLDKSWRMKIFQIAKQRLHPYRFEKVK